MRIGMVLSNHTYPPDPRVAKEARVLADAGHEMHLLALAAPQQPSRERVGVFDVERHRQPAGIAGKLDALVNLLTYSSPSWRSRIRLFIQENRIEALHIHDLHMARAALQAARAEGVPATLDLHENYPEALRHYKRKRLYKVFLSPRRTERLESDCIRRADRVVVVVDEAKDRLVSDGVPADKVIVFGNMEPRAWAEKDTSVPDLSHGPRLAYFGNVDPHRGLDTAIAAMPMILERSGDARLTIIGPGASVDDLERQAELLGVGDAVSFLGWMDAVEAMDIIATSTIALVPHHRSPHTDATMPHKLFQYMGLGRPVLVSDCPPLARVVRESGAGEVFTSGDPVSFADAVGRMHDPDVAASQWAAGRSAVAGRYNLEADAEALLGVYAEGSSR